MKKFILISIIILIIIIGIIICFKSNTQRIDDLISINIPIGYMHEENDIMYKNKLASTHYNNGTTTFCCMLLSHKGDAIMGSDETLKEILDYTDIKDKIKIDDLDVYIYPIGINSSDKEIEEKSDINCIFEYKEYLILIGMTNIEGQKVLEKDDIQTFYKIINSIKLK